MFEYDGDEYTLEELQFSAEDQSLDFTTFMKRMTNLGMVEKQTDFTIQDPDGESDDGTLALIKKIATAEEKGGGKKEVETELESLLQIPNYYDEDRLTPDPNFGFFPDDNGETDPFMQPTDQISNQVAEFYTIQENDYKKDKHRLHQIGSEEAQVYFEENNPLKLSQPELDARSKENGGLGDDIWYANPDIFGDPKPEITRDTYNIERDESYYDQSEEQLSAREEQMLAETKKVNGFVFQRNNNDPLQVDAEISEYSPNLLSVYDQDIQDLIKKGDQEAADKMAEDRDYKKLYDENGKFTDYIPIDMENEAIDKSSSNLDDLMAEQRNAYARFIASQKLAARNATGGNWKGMAKYGVGVTDHISGFASSDRQALYNVGLGRRVSINANANKLIEKVNALPGNSPITQEHNRNLDKLKTITRAIELNMNPALLPEEAHWKEIIDNRTADVISNDEALEIFNDFTETNLGLKLKTGIGEGSGTFGEERTSTVRGIAEGGRNFVDHFAELAAALYITKRLPIGVLKRGKGVVTLETGLKTGLNKLGTGLKSLNQSRTYGRFVDISLGGVKELVVLGGADLVSSELFGTEGMVYNTKTKEFHPEFAIALGVGGVAAKEITNKILRTESLFTRVLGRLNKTAEPTLLSSIGGAGTQAATGTLVLKFGEIASELLSDDQQYRLMADGNYESIDQWKEILGWRSMIETFIGMTMLGGKATATNMYRGMRGSIASLKGSTVRGNDAATGLGIKVNSTNSTIKTTSDTKIRDINKDKTLSESEKLEKIKQVKTWSEDLHWENERRYAIKLAKKEGKKDEALENTYALGNKILQKEKFTPEEIERLHSLKDYEYDIMKSRMGFSKNSANGRKLDEMRDTYKTIVDQLDAPGAARIFGEERDNVIRQIVNGHEIQSEIGKLKDIIKNHPETEGINNVKLDKLQLKLDAINEKIGTSYDIYNTKVKEIQRTYGALMKTYAKKLEADDRYKIVNHETYSKELAKRYNVDIKEAREMANESEGFYDRYKDLIFINKEVADANKNPSTEMHEVIHRILRNSFKNADGVMTKEGINAIDAFRDIVEKNDPKASRIIEGLIETNYKYEYDKEGNRKEVPKEHYYEEYLNTYFTALTREQIKYTPSVGETLSEFVLPFVRKVYPQYQRGKKTAPETGRDLYNMMRGFHRTASKGEVLESAVELGLKGERMDKGEGIIQESREREIKELGYKKPTVKGELGKRLNKAEWDRSVGEVYLKLFGERGQPGLLDGVILKGLKGSDIFGKPKSKFIEDVKIQIQKPLFDFDPTINDNLSGYMNFYISKRKVAILDKYEKEKFQKPIEGEGAPILKAEPSGPKEVVGKQLMIADKFGDAGIVLNEKIHSMVESGKIDPKGKSFKNLRKLVTKDVAKLFIGEADAVQRYIKDGLSKEEAEIKAAEEFVYVDDGSAFWKSPKGKKLLGTSIADSIEKKLLEDANLNKQDIKLIQMKMNKMGASPFINIVLPEGHTNLLAKKKTTWIPRVVKNEFYNKSSKRVGNDYPWYKKPNITDTQMYDFVGITERGNPNLYKKDSNTSIRIKDMLMLTERMFVNQGTRQKLVEDGKIPLSDIIALGEGKPLLAFSKDLREQIKKDPEKGVHIITKLQQQAESILSKTGNNYKASFNNIFAGEIERGYLDRKVIEGIAKDWQVIHDRYSRKPEKDVILKDFSVEEIVTEQLVYDALNPRQYYKTIVEGRTGQKELKSITDPEFASIVRTNVLRPLAEHFGPEFSEAFLYPGVNAPAKIGKGEVFFTDINTFEKTPGWKPTKLNKKGKKVTQDNRKGVTTGEVDSRMVLKTKKGEIGSHTKLPAIATKGKLSSEQMKTVKKHKDQTIKSQQEHNQAFRKVVGKLKDMYDSKDVSVDEVVAVLELMNANPKGLTRTSAILDFLPSGKFEGLATLEHMTPALKVNLRALNYILSGKETQPSIDFNNTMDNYRVSYMPEKYDIALNKFYKSGIPIYSRPNMSPLVRIFNPETYDLMAGLKFEQLSTGSIIGRDMVVNKRLWNKINKNKKTALGNLYNKEMSQHEVNQNLNTVSKVVLLHSKSNPKKGMSAWDFDDTLARTKSGVRYTLPNPSGKPAPGRKVIFMAGGPGSGKSTVIKGLGLEKQGFKVVNQDISLQWLAKNSGLPTDMRDFTPEQASKWSSLGWDARMIAKHKQSKFQGKGDGIIIDGTGNSLNVMKNHVQEFKNKGYDVQMVFVETSLETALQRNRARKERSLRDKIVIKTHESVQNNKEAFKELFGDSFAEVNTDNLKQADAMPLDLATKMNKFTKGYIKGRLDAGEYAHKGMELEAQGAKFDFTEFDYVKEGERGPLFGKAMERAKKFGTKDQFVITARPHAAKMPIFRFLDAQGLKIPFENIITLESSSAEAKAMFVLEKFKEGYNDIYFADDAMQNIKAVKEVLDQLDIKSKVQQAIQHSREKLSSDFNKIIEEVKGVRKEITFDVAKARISGSGKGKYAWVLPPSASDFELLTSYTMAGKGKKGQEHQEWWNKNLFKPFAKGVNNINTSKQAITNDYLALRKIMPGAKNRLRKKVPGTKFTYDTAMRVHRWTEAGYEVPGLSKADAKTLNNAIKNDGELLAFSEQLGLISKMKEGWVKPTEHWLAENITADLEAVNKRVRRKEFLAEWIENKNIIFDKNNLNKIEALYGERHREAIEDMLWRMENGTNRHAGMNKITNQFMNWQNRAVGAIMNFNMRSASLQLLSTVNYINWGENNPIAAAKAFANQPQYWKDFATLWNSDMLVQRRAGLKMNVNEAELASHVHGANNKATAALDWFLKKGFIPTKTADSFAIASGGATYYRNRIKTYEKQGLETKKAEKKAFLDFQEIAEKTQQSARPDLISQEQASPLGRIILPFANTPLQYNRLAKKEVLDIANGRFDGAFGDNSLTSKIGKIVYYTAVQNFIFSSLQAGMFSLIFDDQEEDYITKKQDRIANNMSNSLLRGMGVYGASIAALKDGVLRFLHENEKDYRADYANVAIDMLNISPTIGSKVRKLKSAGDSYKWNKDIIPEMGFDIENPLFYAIGNTTSAITNVPLDRLVTKVNNVKGALDTENNAWQRVALMMGWNRWDLGMEKPKSILEVKEKVKEKKKKKKKKKKFKTFKTFKMKTL